MRGRRASFDPNSRGELVVQRAKRRAVHHHHDRLELGLCPDGGRGGPRGVTVIGPDAAVHAGRGRHRSPTSHADLLDHRRRQHGHVELHLALPACARAPGSRPADPRSSTGAITDSPARAPRAARRVTASTAQKYPCSVIEEPTEHAAKRLARVRERAIRADTQPRLLAFARRLRRALPGDERFGDPLSTAGVRAGAGDRPRASRRFSRSARACPRSLGWRDSRSGSRYPRRRAEGRGDRALRAAVHRPGRVLLVGAGGRRRGGGRASARGRLLRSRLRSRTTAGGSSNGSATA